MVNRTAAIRRWLPASLSMCVAVVLSQVLSADACFASELRQSPVVKAVQAARPSIVNIRGEKTLAASPSQSAANESVRRVNGMGTGVIIDSRGYIVTNYHVVDGVKEIQVTRDTHDKYVARLVARDLETDLAIIKIDVAETLPIINVGSSGDLMPGESVIAVGNAYGYEHTVTRGIISALHRAVQVSDAQFYDDLIQTDASINPGNSGGPLLNIDGEMIGINVAVRAGAQGIGFAIPIDKVMAVAAELISNYNQRRTHHGLVLSAVATGDAVSVASVEADSPAFDAGIEPGDVIKTVGSEQVKRPLDFQRALLDRKPGQQVEIVVHRKDDDLTLNVKLAEVSKESKSIVTSQPTWDTIGLEVKAIPAEEFRQKYQTRYRGGLVVTNVRGDSPAASQGIRRGDVLVGMHIWETVSLENVNYILNRPDFGSLAPVKFFILRGGETLYGYLPIATKKSTETR